MLQSFWYFLLGLSRPKKLVFLRSMCEPPFLHEPNHRQTSPPLSRVLAWAHHAGQVATVHRFPYQEHPCTKLDATPSWAQVSGGLLWMGGVVGCRRVPAFALKFQPHP